MSSRPDLRGRLAAARAQREREGLLRRVRTCDVLPGGRRVVGKRILADFCGNDYLGLASHRELVAALTRSAAVEGVGTGAAHLVSGHRGEHAALEEELADWTGRERAVLFSTGVMANLGALQALLNAGAMPGGRDMPLCVQDKLNHASLIDGAQLAGASLRRYPHADVEGAARQLDAQPDVPALLATDGVFSMDGDIAPLAALAQLCRERHALLYVDDAHGLGVLGRHGAGSLAAAGLGSADAPVLMGTLGKALGCAGAFVAGDADLMDAIVQFARPYIYTTAMPAALAAATRAAVRLVREDSEGRRERLAANIARFRAGAAQLGLPLMPSQTAIQPLVLGDAGSTLAAARMLEREGFLVVAIRPPTVPQGAGRLRITLSAAHNEARIDALLDALARLPLPTQALAV
ncbi:8-amino-7-oxononanoate synthase [Luteibacter aegosomaticola]|uniref:8-amino-7-oxononanoate synthase n=1 Tax=Luteibacter aegosomaticola TaxID=2911538 RepID=UPI001FF92D4F|nr:8-amino-7-oxononanoate synthase [Luteibacter aegosomaticola]UPG89917.1 8-amino-7-oxononanoate synthase [Luteibacter aegosomaticola]